MKHTYLSLVMMMTLLSGCRYDAENTPVPSVNISDKRVSYELFGSMPDGKGVELYTLVNEKGWEARFITLGGTLVSLKVPDREGNFSDVVLGFDDLENYRTNSPFFGCITGRFANRIAKGKFTIDGKQYNLATNNGPNHLHGGEVGFDKRVYVAEAGKTDEGVYITFSDTSPDGDQGYPGTLSTVVTYTLTDEGVLRITYSAETDKPTVINLTHHSYFNLAGEGAGDILDHQLTLHCSRYTPTDATSIPTGTFADVKDTPFDFLEARKIGERIDDKHEQIQFGKGYDHNMVIDGEPGTLRIAAEINDPDSGRHMSVWTDQPGIQFYTGNFLDGAAKGKSGKLYGHRSGFCLETQNYPDAPNRPDFPSSVLRPGETYTHHVEYRFSAE